MKDLISDAKLVILRALADGKFHSGQTLGEQLGITRAAIAKHVKQLMELGLDIYSVTGKGYKLAEAFTLLNHQNIRKEYDQDISLDVFPVIDSTNAYLMRQIRQDKMLTDGHTVLAECQTAGRGRRGRSWISPFGSHIYLSRYYQTSEGLGEAAGLSLAVGVAVAEAINKVINKAVGNNYCGNKNNKLAKLKWPNDVLIEDKKIAGVLIEAEGQSDGICHLVVGIGININMPKIAAEGIDQPWTDLNSHTTVKIDRNEFSVILLKELDNVMQEYRINKLNNLADEWNNNNAYKGKVVNIIGIKDSKSGKCIGIDQTGALLIEEIKTKGTFRVFGGEVSLRKV